MRALIAATIGLIVAGVIVWIVAHDSIAGQGIALALVGIACVLGVSGVFLVVGRSEDAERAAAATPPAVEPEPGPAGDPHPRPALDRRRPLPPRRPS
jgi:hypothetical protein